MVTNMAELEDKRSQLEANVSKLQSLVKHWRTWEAEYEGMKEGIAELGDDASEAEIKQIADECEGELLTKQEILALVDDHGRTRKSDQISGLLERRIDYVRQNVSIMEKRLENETERLEQIDLVGAGDEDLPLMEITEQLDDDDNVISSSVVRPGDAAPELLKVLQKSGIEEDQLEEEIKTVGSDEFKKDVAQKVVQQDSTTEKSEPHSLKDGENPQNTAVPPLKKKKSVTFAAETQIHHVPSEPAPRRVRFTKGLDVLEQQPVVDPIIPENESTEDMLLRREMLEYNMRDVGTIVAEIDINDQDGSDEDSDEDYDDEEEESEDEFGRTTTQVITDRYREKMLEMEKRLNARAIINVGPDFKDGDTAQGSLKSPASTKAQQSKNDGIQSSEGRTLRAVHFADKLDIQEASTDKLSKSEEDGAVSEVDRPLKDEIVERSPVDIPAINSKTKKVSRFKASRGVGSETQGSTTGSPSIHSDIVERPITEHDILQEPDDLNPQLHIAEVRNTYHQMRNRLIQRENGFMDQEMEQYEDEYGRPQISRFKAARLARQKAEVTDEPHYADQ